MSGADFHRAGRWRGITLGMCSGLLLLAPRLFGLAGDSFEHVLVTVFGVVSLVLALQAVAEEWRADRAAKRGPCERCRAVEEMYWLHTPIDTDEVRSRYGRCPPGQSPDDAMPR